MNQESSYDETSASANRVLGGGEGGLLEVGDCCHFKK
jgi:hypothetical protein